MEAVERLNWRKAKASGANGGGCVEVADHAEKVHVRDTTARERGMITVTAATWRTFLDDLKAGRADLPRLTGRRSAPARQESHAGADPYLVEPALSYPKRPCLAASLTVHQRALRWYRGAGGTEARVFRDSSDCFIKA